MRILHIDTGREMRGGQHQALLLMRGLREASHDCLLIARGGTPLESAARSLGFETHPATLLNVLRRSPWADVVHAHDARAHTLAAIAARKPFVVSRRVAFPVKRGFVSRWKYGRARRYLAVSRFVASELERAGIAKDQIDVVYDGCEPVTKNCRRPVEFQAVALDSPDPAKARGLVQQAAKMTGIDVRFSADLRVDLPCASVFLYSTESEGLGSAALLAMSLEVPVIASRVGGLPEIVEHGITGLLVENSPAAFAEALTKLKCDRELRERLGRNARARAEAEFTAGRMLERTLESYRRALAGRQGLAG